MTRRRHPAAASRVLAAGVATATTLGLTGAMAVAGPPAETVAPSVAPDGDGAGQVLVVRRLVLPSGEPVLAAIPAPSGGAGRPVSRSRGS